METLCGRATRSRGDQDILGLLRQLRGADFLCWAQPAQSGRTMVLPHDGSAGS